MPAFCYVVILRVPFESQLQYLTYSVSCLELKTNFETELSEKVSECPIPTESLTFVTEQQADVKFACFNKSEYQQKMPNQKQSLRNPIKMMFFSSMICYQLS